MIYEEKVDAHTQYPPDELSVSLNVMVTGRNDQQKDQYIFDPIEKTIVELPKVATIYRRASAVRLASAFADVDTVDIFSDLLKSSPCRRIRESVLDAVVNIKNVSAQEKHDLILIGASDKDELVRSKAASMLDELFL